jgi:drug/metabolite transporter (DMT)-like permease
VTVAAGGNVRSIAFAAMPGVFVYLWSTGFIGAKFGLPYAGPLTFLSLRFAVVIGLLSALIAATGAPWPREPRQIAHIAIAGVLVHATYLGGVFASISQGVDAGVSALIVGVQPVLTALLASPLLGERVTARQWAGHALGMAGVGLVVWRKLGLGEGTPFAMALSVLALLGITAGTLYQKRFCAGMDLRTGSLVQFAASLALIGPLALILEDNAIVWSGEFLFALFWMTVVMSLGAITLLMLLIRRGEASRVASLFFLVPPTTALLAWPLFDERLGPVALLGMALAAAGVALVNLRR